MRQAQLKKVYVTEMKMLTLAVGVIKLCNVRYEYIKNSGGSSKHRA